MIKLDSRQKDILTFLGIELTFAYFWSLMYRQQLYDNLLIGGDIGLSDVNGPILQQLMGSSVNLWNLFATLVFQISPVLLVPAWNFIFFISSFSMPVGIYILLKQLKFRRTSQGVGSIFYSLNPLSILMGVDWEYSFLLFFIPLIFLFLFRFYKSREFKEILLADVTLFLFFFIMGIDYVKFLIFIIIPFIFLFIISKSLKNALRNVLTVGVAIGILLIMLAPLVVSTIEAFFLFEASASTNSNVSSALYSIARFEYSSSSIQGTIYALPYVANQLTSIMYENSWFGLLYFSLISVSIIFGITSHNKYREVNLSLVIVLGFLLIFQYGVYNGTFLFLFKDPYVDIYNYPLFFYFTQMFIYTFFFSQLLEYIANRVESIHLISSRNKIRRLAVVTFTVIIVGIILISSTPVIQYEIQANPAGVKSGAPDYLTNLTEALKGYQGQRIMVLPDNVTSL
ncbi:MAG: hypothetical protein ACP5OE_09435, partial [Thermodesulfobium sp.]